MWKVPPKSKSARGRSARGVARSTVSEDLCARDQAHSAAAKGKAREGGGRTIHFFLDLVTGGSSAATIAASACPHQHPDRRQTTESETSGSPSSNTFFNPFCVKAEHSTYLTAPNSLANRSPSSGWTGRCFCRPSFSTTVGSSRRSTWVPTMRQGTPGQ